MPGIVSPVYTSRLLQLQSFKEVVWGTTGQATSRWMGIAPYPSFKPYTKSVLHDEDRGSLQNAFNSNVLQLGGEFSLNWAYASYEDINYALQAAIQAVSPSGGNPYTYTYLAPTNGINPLQSYTLEWGYDIMTGQYAGCVGKKVVIKSESKKPWEAQLSGFYKTFTPNLAASISSSTNAAPIAITTAVAHGLTTGDQVVISGHLVNTNANGTWTITVTGANTFTLNTSTGNGVGGATGTYTKAQTPAIADRSVEAIIFPGTTLAIENAAGTPGTTSFANCLLGFEWSAENNTQPIWTGDSLSPSVFAYDKVKGMLTLKLLENAQVKAMIDNQLKSGGGIVAELAQTSGTKVAKLDFAGVLADDVERYHSESGAVYAEVKLESRYDTGALANSLKSIITNAVSSLP